MDHQSIKLNNHSFQTVREANSEIKMKIIEVKRIQEDYSKHRMKLPLYDIEPRTENNWIAPSATIIGEV